MHPAVEHILVFFEYEHLPPHLQRVSLEFHKLAHQIASGPQNAETTVALRKLLEAKDAAVRAQICEDKQCESSAAEKTTSPD